MKSLNERQPHESKYVTTKMPNKCDLVKMDGTTYTFLNERAVEKKIVQLGLDKECKNYLVVG